MRTPYGELPRDAAGDPIAKPEDWPKRPAAGRALAYIAHAEGPGLAEVCPLFGPTFGTVYDISTVVILWFAGASAMAGLLNLVPRYLPQFGMAPEWARAARPLVLLFTAVNLLVTWVFRANVDAQGGAYATGVLVLMTSACAAAAIDKYRVRKGRWWARVPWGFALITAVFVYTTVANEVEKHFRGLTVASCFVAAILLTSFVSRVVRSRELRFAGFRFASPEARLLWDTIRADELSVLVPHRPGQSLAEKERAIRREHRIPRDLMLTFVEVELADPSEFVGEPVLDVVHEGSRYAVKVNGAASVAHTLAAVALEMAKVGKPPEIHFGWAEGGPVGATLGFLLFGHGNVPWLVRELLHRAEPDPARRPRVIIADSWNPSVRRPTARGEADRRAADPTHTSETLLSRSTRSGRGDALPRENLDSRG